MKRHCVKKKLSLFLAFIMFALMLPLSPIVFPDNSSKTVSAETSSEPSVQAQAQNEKNYSSEDYLYLGRGYNVLSGKSISDPFAINNQYSIIDMNAFYAANKDSVHVININHSENNFISADSAYEFSSSYSSKLTASVSAKVPIAMVSIKANAKFSTNASSSSSEKRKELYEMFSAETNKKNVYMDFKNDFRSYLDDNFESALSKVKTDADIENLFFNYGTHMVSAYILGGRVEFSYYTYSTDIEHKDKLTTNFQAALDAKIGKIQAGGEFETVDESSIKSTYSNAVCTFKSLTIGGEAFEDTSINTALKNYKTWIDAINAGKNLEITGVPYSTALVPIWELLPDDKIELQNKMIDVYNKSCQNLYTEFCKEYPHKTVGDDEVTFDSCTYISGKDLNVSGTNAADKAFFNVPFGTDDELKVAPGSMLYLHLNNLNLSDYIFSQYVITSGGEYASVDQNSGVVTVNKNAAAGKTFTVAFQGDGLTVAEKTFTIENEGVSKYGNFAGGYGTKERPYLIATAEQLNNLTTTGQEEVTGDFRLISDINYGGNEWGMIHFFKGVFDGNGHAIYNFKVTKPKSVDEGSVETHKLGFIGDNRGTVKNVQFGKEGYTTSVVSSEIGEHSSKVTKMMVGVCAAINGSAGTMENCKVINCTVGGTVKDVNNNQHLYCDVGGLVGWNLHNIDNCTVKNCGIDLCINSVNDSGDNNIGFCGGIVGSMMGDVKELSNCLSLNNKISLKVKGDGVGKNSSILIGYCGGVVAVIDGNTNKVEHCASYGNTITADVSAVINKVVVIKGIGYIVANIGNNATCSNSYADKTPLWELCSGSKQDVEQKDFSSEFSIDRFTFDDVNGKKVPRIPDINLTGVSSDHANNYYDGKLFDYGGISVSGTADNKGNPTTYTYDGIITDFTLEPDSLINIISYGGKTAQLEINRIAKAIDGISVFKSPYNNALYEGDALNLEGLSLQLNYNNGDSEVLSWSQVEQLIANGQIVVSDYAPNTIGTQTITVTYMGKTASFTVENQQVVPDKLEVIEDPESANVNYSVGASALDLTGISLMLTYNNGDTEIISDAKQLNALIDKNTYDLNTAGKYSVTLNYKDLSASFDINVGSVSQIEISKLPEKLVYYTSSTKIDTTGLELIATYTNGVKRIINSGFTVGSCDFSKAGYQDITVTYPKNSGVTTYFEVEVKNVEQQSIAVVNMPKSEYCTGDVFNTVGMQVRATYNDGSVKTLSSSEYYFLVDGASGYNECPTFTALGEKEVTVYSAEDALVNTSFTVNVKVNQVERIEVTDMPKTSYNLGEKFDETGMTVSAVYSNGKVETVSNYTVVYDDFNEPGTQVVKISYKGKDVFLTVEVLPPVSLKIVSYPDKTVYELGETFDAAGLAVEAVYKDGDKTAVPFEDLIIEYPEVNGAGTYFITAKYVVGSTAVSVDITVMVEEPDPATLPGITVDSVQTLAGKTVEVNLVLRNNPGIAGCTLTLSYDDQALTLVGAEQGEALGMLSMMTPNSHTVIWFSSNEDTQNGVMLTLTFEVSSEAAIGYYDIGVSYEEGGIADSNENDIELSIQNGGIEILKVAIGDVNNDGVINVKDIIRICKYIADKNSVEIIFDVADVNKDGAINVKDIIRICKYIADKDSVVLG